MGPCAAQGFGHDRADVGSPRASPPRAINCRQRNQDAGGCRATIGTWKPLPPASPGPLPGLYPAAPVDYVGLLQGGRTQGYQSERGAAPGTLESLCSGSDCRGSKPRGRTGSTFTDQRALPRRHLGNGGSSRSRLDSLSSASTPGRRAASSSLTSPTTSWHQPSKPSTRIAEISPQVSSLALFIVSARVGKTSNWFG